MNVREVLCKSVLTKSNLPEVEYCINPYTGCSHGCRYCYARFMRRFSGHQEAWGDFVDVKINAPEVLRKQMKKSPQVGEVLLGSVTDAYQPVERKYRITREILEILLEYGFPVSVLSKSDLVVRDIDLFKRFTSCEVGLTVTTTDDVIARDFEPFTTPSSKRIETLAKLCESGVSTYAFIGPIFPGLTDLDAVFSALSGKVRYVMAESLNLRCGNWEDMKRVLDEKYPEYRDEFRASMSRSYWKDVREHVLALGKRYGIPVKGYYDH